MVWWEQAEPPLHPLTLAATEAAAAVGTHLVQRGHRLVEARTGEAHNMGVLGQRPPGAPGQGKEGGEDEAEHIVLVLRQGPGGGAGLMRVLLRCSNCRSD